MPDQKSAPPPLPYRSPEPTTRAPRARWSVSAFGFALVALAWVSYVELMQTAPLIRLGLCDRERWSAMEPTAWAPCGAAIALSVLGLVQRRRDRSFSWSALAISGGALLWWIGQPALWR